MTVPVVASRAKTETSSSIAAPLPPPTAPPKGTRRIVILSGDNIGPEVTGQARRVLDVVFGLRAQRHGVRVHMVEGLLGGAAIDAEGTALPRATIELIDHEETAAILLGCVGGPQWPAVAGMPRPEEGRTERILALRKHLQCYANIRPCTFPSTSLVACSPLKEELVRGVDFIVVRELCGGIYFGAKTEQASNASSSDDDVSASDTCTYSVGEIRRVTCVAGALARDMARSGRYSSSGAVARVTSIDKANVLASSRLWRRVVSETMAKEFPEVELKHLFVDAAAMHMIKNPRSLNGVVLTSNLFGDILSDESSVIPGSLGLLPSASLNGWPGADHNSKVMTPALYEPIHGSAPDIVGKGIANPVGAILSVTMMLRYSFRMPIEAQAVEDAVCKVLDDQTIGGYGYRTADLGGTVGTVAFGDKVCEVLREILGKLGADEFVAEVQEAKAISQVQTTTTAAVVGDEADASRRRPMNLCEKIIAHHAVGLSAPGNIQTGDMVCVKVDWTLASELTWKGMEKTYSQMGRPKIWRNDRFWLAVDHTVDPKIYDQPKPKELIHASECFAKEVGLKDFHGPNETILHTDFYRERAQPGMLVVGADSHSCSAGGLGTFAVGLGAADVVMPLVTGETWFKVPEICEIKFVGAPPLGIGGKDVILWVLGELKRNTVAFERAVEFTGPGCRHLSCDARFAIANMTTEFGGIAGVFEADELTAAYIAKRKNEDDKNDAVYFRADPDATYAETHVIDLSKVDSMVALYPSPDNVVPVTAIVGMNLDGVFIGACTTAEEDLILGALVLEAGLKLGYMPSLGGKRKVTPGSLGITAKLRRLGLLEIYERAGFEIDKAGEGEVWLSSQNRNFKNRMGKGSIGNLASAATCAASSFEMRVQDPRSLVDLIDQDRFHAMLASNGVENELQKALTVPTNVSIKISEPEPTFATAAVMETMASPPPSISNVIKGRVQRFGHHVDTDAIIPAEFMPGVSDEDLGTHCFQYVRPEFREKAAQGFSIVVAGAGFGSGSSREEAPRALKGCGIQAVIAKSYAFIYARNQPNLALLGVTVQDFDRFYELAQEGVSLELNVASRIVTIVDEHNGATEEFKIVLSQMEERLISGGGVTDLYQTYGKSLFRAILQ